jgi:hypothetical protein
MKEYTQSNLSPGNCWQTVIACILEIDPEKLPPQHEIEVLDNHKFFGGWGSYMNVLNGYLSKHHGLCYFEIHGYQFGGVRPTNPFHLLAGPTVRTEEHRKAGRLHTHHAIVGHMGEPVWDPHPSRAGLLEVERWGVLGTDQQTQKDNRARKMDNDPNYRFVFDCLCPECGLKELHRRVSIEKAKDAVVEKLTK